MRFRTVGATLTAMVFATGLTPDCVCDEVVATPTVRIERWNKPAGSGAAILRFVITNPNPRTVYFFGMVDPVVNRPTTTIRPLYTVKVLRDGTWVGIGSGGCGESDMIPLPPRAKRYFTTTAPEGKWHSMRAGVSWGATPDVGKSEVVWSSPLPRYLIK